jgi:DNA polymerase III subunit delta'
LPLACGGNSPISGRAVFDEFCGNVAVAGALTKMLDTGRIPQTILLEGAEGVGKATLARRFAAQLLGGKERIEQDDLSLAHNRALLADREKWPGEKRSDDPLLLSSHPDFITFAPDGPLHQLSIQQMRLLKERAQYRPLAGRWRVFLIDQIDRANLQAADSLLKTLEEPPEHLILFLTAENLYDLPPTIRSRSILFHLAPLSLAEMREFMRGRDAGDTDRRIALAAGSPGVAATLDLAAYEKRRAVMLAMLEASAGETPFSAWVQESEAFLQSKTEKLDLSLKLLYGLLEDLLTLAAGGSEIRNVDLGQRLSAIARHVSFEWLRDAVRQADELVPLQRRNVQKGPSVDNFVVSLRSA